jgi:hypothetical protein
VLEEIAAGLGGEKIAKRRIERYSPPRRGGEGCGTNQSCEATEAPQTGAKRERDSAKP